MCNSRAAKPSGARMAGSTSHCVEDLRFEGLAGKHSGLDCEGLHERRIGKDHTAFRVPVQDEVAESLGKAAVTLLAFAQFPGLVFQCLDFANQPHALAAVAPAKPCNDSRGTARGKKHPGGSTRVKTCACKNHDRCAESRDRGKGAGSAQHRPRKSIPQSRHRDFRNSRRIDARQAANCPPSIAFALIMYRFGRGLNGVATQWCDPCSFQRPV